MNARTTRAVAGLCQICGESMGEERRGWVFNEEGAVFCEDCFREATAILATRRGRRRLAWTEFRLATRAMLEAAWRIVTGGVSP